MRKYLSVEATKTLVHPAILSRIDYANALMYGISAAQLFVRSGLVKSGKEAKRLIAENGARVDDKPLTDPGQMFDAGALAAPIKLSAGKKRHALVKRAD